jgi:hypothetical protein
MDWVSAAAMEDWIKVGKRSIKAKGWKLPRIRDIVRSGTYILAAAMQQCSWQFW